MKKIDAGLVKFFAEIGVLKRLPKQGMLVLSNAVGEGTVGQHVVRAAQIGYVLAYLEKVDPEKVACMVLFHDNGEARISDAHKVSARYVDKKDGEKRALKEQLDNIPKELGTKISDYYQQYRSGEALEGQLARDADLLEIAITAKEIMEQGGTPKLQNWIDNVRKMLKTNSAKRILELVNDCDDFTNSWWQGLKKIG